MNGKADEEPNWRELVYRLSLRLGATLDLSTEVMTLLTGLRESGCFVAAAVLLLDESQEHLRVHGTWGLTVSPEETMPVGTDLTAWWRAALPRERQADWQAASLLALPLTIEGRLLGVLAVECTAPQVVEACVPSLNTIASLAASVFRNLQRYQALERTVAELEQRNAELQEFARIVAHDLQAPLRTLWGFAGFLQEEYAEMLDDRAREYVKFIHEGAQRADRLLTALHEYARLGTRGLTWETVDLGEVLQNCVQDLQATIEETAAEIVLTSHWPKVQGDRALLQQLVQNLLANALQFRRPEVPLRIEVTWREEKQQIVLIVKDNGLGIAKEYQERIFQIFQRLHPEGTYDGLGLGLALVKKTAELHRGQVWVESEPGRGSTFFVALPRGEGKDRAIVRQC